MPIDPTIYNRRSPIQPVDVEAILGPDPAQQSQRGSPALEASRILTLQKQQREQQLAMQYGDDPETFIRELSRVDPEKSESYRKTWLDALKTSAERHKADVENQRAHISLGVNLVQGATPNTWPAIRTAITAMSPDLAQLLPEQFDEQEIGKLIEIGRTSDQYLDAQAKAADLLASGKTQQAFWQGIAGTSNQAQLDAAKALATKARLTPYLKMLGDQPWTPALQQEAVTKAMDPKDQYAAANPQAAAASSGGSDYAKFLASFAREKGKPVDQLTVAENVQAKKLFGQADDAARRPPQPVVIVTSAGPQLLDKSTGTTRGITDASGQTLGLAPTAEMRNKEAARATAYRSVAAIRSLSKKIIKRVGPAQRADAIKRGAAAVFGSDPDFRAYQDARVALAGNLAVMQQGSRPSDADIFKSWLPMVPDAYTDTSESADIKWGLIDVMSGQTPSGGGVDTTGVEVWRWEKGPDGKARRVKK